MAIDCKVSQMTTYKIHIKKGRTICLDFTERNAKSFKVMHGDHCGSEELSFKDRHGKLYALNSKQSSR